MPIDLSAPGGVALALLPEIILSAWALLLMLVAAWRPDGDARVDASDN